MPCCHSSPSPCSAPCPTTSSELKYTFSLGTYRERRRAQPTSAPPQLRRRSASTSQRVHTIVWCTGPPVKTLRARPWASAACGVAPLVDRQRRVGCSMDSSCELLRSLCRVWGSVHCCGVPCRTMRSISKHQGGDVQRRASLGGVRLTERTREAHGWVWVYGEALSVHCCGSHMH